MRCVNREFENKVSAYLFGVVVVPFKPEIYGIAPEPKLGSLIDAQIRTNEMLQGAVLLQDKGMRVFQGFGQHIRKFAMSFEFDEKKLANPPIKSDQEAIQTWWGIYRWPFKSYNRYAQLEGLEQTADETRTMAKALRFIQKAKALGLSIDGGLGWLAGPDVNQKVLERGGVVPVFGESKFVPEPKDKAAKGKLGRSSSPPPSILDEGPHTQLKRMLEESGMNGHTIDAGVQMMLETDDTHTDLAQLPTLTPLHRNSFPRHYAVSDDGAIDRANDRTISRIRYGSDEEDVEIDLQPCISACRNLLKSQTEGGSLKPNDLSTAQREMLLEVEWAQRAFMQSYAIAIIDNLLTFHNVESFTIARIPNRHLPILRREDFWSGLPNLKKLSLAIIPDWREVVKLPTSFVEDIKIPPSQAVAAVFRLLEDQISRRQNIKTLHFEWVCGGEEAPGLFARNQHILAAPLVPQAMNMVIRSHHPQLLSLPHVEHLSLKNCWISPHILTRLGLTLKNKALQTLTLDSVSLTASLPHNAQPNALTGGAAHHPHHVVAHHAFLNLPHMVVNHVPQPVVPGLPVSPPVNVNLCPAWLLAPRPGSWVSVIEVLTPGQTLAQLRYARNLEQSEPEPREPGTLTKLEFKSCGYVRLPLDFDQSAIDPPTLPVAQTHAISKRIGDLEPVMLKPYDCTFGIIVNHISGRETQTLENAWNMTVGWGPSRSALLVESTADGVPNAGRGRFDGVIS